MLKTNNRKYDIFKLYYWHGAKLVGKYRLPQLEPNQFIPKNVISFNERKSIKNPEKHWLDFFIDDYHYETFWNHPEKYFGSIRKFAGIITTDYSMMPDMLPGQNIINCTRNRVMAYYLQRNGFNIIPVASWCSSEDFDWCFDGLPNDSSIAISSNGCLSNPYSKQMLLRGIDELQRRKTPFKIIVCGRSMEELNDYNNIVYYPNFSQRWRNRMKYGK